MILLGVSCSHLSHASCLCPLILSITHRLVNALLVVEIATSGFGRFERWDWEVAKFWFAKEGPPCDSRLLVVCCNLNALTRSTRTQRWLVEVLGRFVGSVDVGGWVSVESNVSELLEALADRAYLFFRSLDVEVDLR